jgi:glycosyltransferase involved in cell wall biosynthesis
LTANDSPGRIGEVARRRRRILVCNYEYPPIGGGGGVFTAALVNELARRHDVTVLTSQALDLPRVSFDGDVRIKRVPTVFRTETAVANMPSMFSFLVSALLWSPGFCRRNSFDVVNTHFALPTGPLGQWLANRLQAPNVLTLHGGDLYDPSKRLSPHRHWVFRRAVRSVLQGANALVANSRNTAVHVHDIYGVDRTVRIVPLGISRPALPVGVARAAFGLPEDAFVMVTVGRLILRKQTLQLVRSLAACGVANAHLVVIGDGPEKDDVSREAAECGVASRVHLLGAVSEEDKYGVLSISDVFVSASEHEGFGLVFVEAMASGLPIVCYDDGGQTDFLATGRTGHLVRLNDTAAFAAALRELASSPLLCAEIGAANRQLAEEFFIERCAERYENVFEEAIDRHANPA